MCYQTQLDFIECGHGTLLGDVARRCEKALTGMPCSNRIPIPKVTVGWCLTCIEGIKEHVERACQAQWKRNHRNSVAASTIRSLEKARAKPGEEGTACTQEARGSRKANRDQEDNKNDKERHQAAVQRYKEANRDKINATARIAYEVRKEGEELHEEMVTMTEKGRAAEREMQKERYLNCHGINQRDLMLAPPRPIADQPVDQCRLASYSHGHSYGYAQGYGTLQGSSNAESYGNYSNQQSVANPQGQTSNQGYGDPQLCGGNIQGYGGNIQGHGSNPYCYGTSTGYGYGNNQGCGLWQQSRLWLLWWKMSQGILND